MQIDSSCERAREWASLRLDGELPEFHRGLLEAHLRGCVGCRDSVQTAEALTMALRSAAWLERPTHGIRLHESSRRRSHARVRFVVAGVAAVCVVVLFALGGGLQRDGSQLGAVSAGTDGSRQAAPASGLVQGRPSSPPLSWVDVVWARVLHTGGAGGGGGSGMPIL
jgi:predicted anti-sigma-YlaC factor YlaD